MSAPSNFKLQVFFRNPRAGYSIHRVFAPLLPIFQAQEKDVESFDAPCHTASPLSLLRNLWFAFRRYSTRAVCHMTGDAHYLFFALPFAKKVITIHDLVTLRLGGIAPLRWLRRRLWFSWVLPLADSVVCISEKTRSELLANFSIAPQKVRVIPNPVDPIFQHSPKPFDTTCPHILHIGTNWNKNVTRTIEALRGIPCKLIVVGMLSDEQLQLLREAKISYEMLQNLNDAQMKAQYERCDIVSFPSLFEGFGMPVIEGQAVGRPVLTSSISPLTEVAGDAACYINPESVESIREGFLRLINDEAFRTALVEKGLHNVQRFEASVIAQQYLQLYHSL